MAENRPILTLARLLGDTETTCRAEHRIGPDRPHHSGRAGGQVHSV